MHRRLLNNLVVAYLLTTGAVIAAIVFAVHRGVIHVLPHDRLAAPIVLSIAAAVGMLMLFIAIGIGVYVWTDARRRGMEPFIWTLVAVFVPYFIGFVIYLTQRQPLRVGCPACGAAASEREAFCPACGTPLRQVCAACQRPLAEGGRFCPHCGAASVAAVSGPGAA